MSNRLQLTGILTPPAGTAWRGGVGFVRFEPYDDVAANWAVPGYRPAWPIIGVPSAAGISLQEMGGGGALYVPGETAGTTYKAPLMRVSYELQTVGGSWHRGHFIWRAVTTGGTTIDIRMPAPEMEPPHVERPGVPPQGLTTAHVGQLVAALQHTHTAEQITNLREALRNHGLTRHNLTAGETFKLPMPIVGLYRIWTDSLAAGYAEIAIYSLTAGTRRAMANLSDIDTALINVATGLTRELATKEPTAGILRMWINDDGDFCIKNANTVSMIVNIRKLE